MQPRIGFTLRLVLSLLTGLAVFGLACGVAYQQYCGSDIRMAPLSTLHAIQTLANAVEAYRAQNHALPETLSDIRQHPPHDDLGQPLHYTTRDVWGRPLHYTTDGKRYRIFSCGADGKPGGTGLDAGLSTDDLQAEDGLPSRITPTFGQFVAGVNHGELSGGLMFADCVLGGLAAFLLGLRTLSPGAGRPEAWALAVRLVVMAIAATLVAICIAALHVPSGH